MEIYKKPGTKERLFEMMNNVNKKILKEDFDYNDAEKEHLGKEDLTADQEQNPEYHDNSPIMDEPSKRDFDDKEQVSIKEDQNNLIGDIMDQTDGPVTDFVAIFRAIEMASNHVDSPANIANALHNVLEQINKQGSLPSKEFPTS